MRSLFADVILAVAFVVLPATSLLAQQPRQRDTTPFERSKPLAEIASASNRETLTQLQGILAARGYTIASIEWDRGELSAIRKDSPSSDMSDRVIFGSSVILSSRPNELTSTSCTEGSSRSSGPPMARYGFAWRGPKSSPG